MTKEMIKKIDNVDVSIFSAHRGGCLWLGEIQLRSDNKVVYISTCLEPNENESYLDYIKSLIKKHFN